MLEKLYIIYDCGVACVPAGNSTPVVTINSAPIPTMITYPDEDIEESSTMS